MGKAVRNAWKVCLRQEGMAYSAMEHVLPGHIAKSSSGATSISSDSAMPPRTLFAQFPEPSRREHLDDKNLQSSLQGYMSKWLWRTALVNGKHTEPGPNHVHIITDQCWTMMEVLEFSILQKNVATQRLPKTSPIALATYQTAGNYHLQIPEQQFAWHCPRRSTISRGCAQRKILQ